MKAKVIKNLIIKGEMKKAGEIIELSTKDFNTFNHFAKHLEVFNGEISITNNSPIFELDTTQDIIVKENKVKKSKKIK